MTLLITLYAITVVVLVILILMQQSEGGALGIGGGQNSFMTARGAGNALSKVTGVVGVVFFLLSLTLTISSYRSSGGSILIESQDGDSAPSIPFQAPAPTLPDLP